MAACLAACGGSGSSGDEGDDASSDAEQTSDGTTNHPDGSGTQASDAQGGGHTDGASGSDGEAIAPDGNTVDAPSGSEGDDSGSATDGASSSDAADAGGSENTDGSNVVDDGSGGGGSDAGTTESGGSDGSTDAASPEAGASSDDGGGDAGSIVDATTSSEASTPEGGAAETGADGGNTADATTTDATAGGGADAAPDAPSCGDGVVESGEQCDLGMNNSNLFSSCSLSCTTTSLLLHLDATNPSGNGTTPADGTAMASWTDLATGISVVQATSARQPVWYASAIGGEPAFQFDGLQTFFDAALDINYSVLPDVTIIVVVQNFASDPGNYSGIWGADLGGWGRFESAVGQAGGNGVSNGGGFTGITGLNATGTPIVTTTILDGSTVMGSTAYVNGTLAATFTGSTNTNDTRMSIGSLNGPNNYSGGYQEYGYIAEVFVYGTALSDDDRETVEAALTTKY